MQSARYHPTDLESGGSSLSSSREAASGAGRGTLLDEWFDLCCLLDL